MKHEVTGCSDCPLLYDWIDCKGIDSDKQNDVTENVGDFIDKFGSPYWCPLKKEPITIKIKQKDDYDRSK